MVYVGQNVRKDSDSMHCRHRNPGIDCGSGETIREVDSQLEENVTAIKRDSLMRATSISI